MDVDIVGAVGVGCMADGGEEGKVGSGGGRVAMGGRKVVVVRGREMVGLDCGRSRLISARTWVVM